MDVRRVATLGAMIALLVAGVPSVARADGNGPPVAVDDPGPACGDTSQLGGSYPVVEDYHDWNYLAIGCAPLLNDYDPDGDPMAVELVGQPAHGQAKVVAGAKSCGTPAPASTCPDDWIAYLPDHDYSTPQGDWVSDVITYRAFDGQAYSNPASYRIWVAPVNDPPTFTPGPSLVEVHAGDGPVSIPWATDVQPGPPNEAAQHVSFDLDVSAPDDIFAVPPAIDAHGTLTFTPGTKPWLSTVEVTAKDDGGLFYGWNYQPSDPFDQPDDTSDPVTFQIVIDPALPAPPVADDDDVTVDEDTPVTVNVLDNDTDINGDELVLEDIAAPERGTAVRDGTDPNAVRYTPPPDGTGDDTFTYHVNDGHGGRDEGTVHVSIRPVNDAPVASDDTLTVGFDSDATSVPVLDNDHDVDDDRAALRVVSVGDASRGTTALVDGLPAYAPDPGYAGADGFSYTIRDPGGLQSSAHVAVTVSPDGVAPVVDGLATSLSGGKVNDGRVPIRISWHATDTGTGVAASELQEQTGGAWHAVGLSAAGATSAGRSILAGRSTGYRARARDNAGNVGGFASTSVLATLRGDGSAAVHLGGSWSRLADSQLTDGHARVAHRAGSTASLTFTGREVGWISRLGPTGGHAEVQIDGTVVATISLHADAPSRRRVVFHQALGSGVHQIEIRSLGSHAVVVDGFVILR